MLLVLTGALLVATAAEARADETASINYVLQRSVVYWNAGQLDAFMRSYERSPATTYVNAKAVIRGYDSIRQHYASTYGAHPGTLSLSDLAIRPLGADYAVVVARWHLEMHDGSTPSGLFSLVLHRSASGWHIITDHSP